MGNIRLCSTTQLQNRIIDSRDKIYQIALAWCGDEMLADDLVQETIATGIRNYQQLRDEGSMLGWICSIMRNHWYHHLRKQKKHDNINNQMPSSDKGPLGICHEMDLIQQVKYAVAKLSLDQRQIISLVDLGELSYCDVAQSLDIPVGTVMSRLHRARKNLLTKLTEYQDESSTPVNHIHIVEKNSATT